MNICKAIIQEGKNKSNKCDKNITNEHCYSEKHKRDEYRLEYQEKGIHYCDINRGCFVMKGCHLVKNILKRLEKKIIYVFKQENK